jgi:hypothetical protein
MIFSRVHVYDTRTVPSQTLELIGAAPIVLSRHVLHIQNGPECLGIPAGH